eukprot:6173151-Pleurochrysis_carterae.AAC.7
MFSSTVKCRAVAVSKPMAPRPRFPGSAEKALVTGHCTRSRLSKQCRTSTVIKRSFSALRQRWRRGAGQALPPPRPRSQRPAPQLDTLRVNAARGPRHQSVLLLCATCRTLPRARRRPHAGRP